MDVLGKEKRPVKDKSNPVFCCCSWLVYWQEELIFIAVEQCPNKGATDKGLVATDNSFNCFPVTIDVAQL